ncbi:MAG: pyridoxal phosphate-dependent aminotransferase [Saprospiraceae bacterium]
MSSSPLSRRVQAISESETLKMAKMARELKAQGHDVISLSLGEPDFDTPAHIKNAAKAALDRGETKYTPVAGTLELRQAIVQKFKRDNNLHFDVNQIVVSNGAKQSLWNVCQAILNPGDECIIFTPYWVSYSEMVKMAEAIPVYVSAGIEQDFKVSARQVEEAITPKTKMVLFSSPCNPTGSVFTKQELEAIADVIASHEGIYVVSDEIYEIINFTGKHHSIGSIPSIENRVITVNGFAKGFAMTGWRLGYIGAPKEIAGACEKIQGQVTSGANAFSQSAAVTALSADMEPSYGMRKEFEKRRELCIRLLNEIPGIKTNYPTGAFYIFPDISNFFGKQSGDYVIRNADDFCDYLMLTAYVGVVSGGAFGAPDCFRLSYAASEEQLTEAIRRIKVAVEKLQS